VSAGTGGRTVADVDGPAVPSTTWRGGVAGATRATLSTPSLWPVALAGFLARGGILVLLLAIVPFPSAVGLANLIGPTAITAAGLTADTILVLVAAGVGVVLLIVAGSGVGAATDVVLATALDPAPAESLDTFSAIERSTAIRLLGDAVLVAAIAVTARPIFDSLYAELTAPTDVATPLVLRVIDRAAGPIAIIIATWLVVEVLGGIAVRLVILDRVGVGPAIRGALGHVVRRPLSTIAMAALDVAGLAIVVLPLLVAAAAWSGLRGLVEAQAAPATLAGAMIVLAATWIGTLVVAAICATWRGLLWTAEVRRPRH
jgi:hypothetical protein